MEGIVCTTAEQFLDRIGRRSPDWNNGERVWIFRGHADATWELIPKALRRGNRKDTWERQIDYEELLLVEYYVEAQRHGLQIPEDNYTLLNEYAAHIMKQAHEAKEGTGDWLPQQMCSLAALAQHYGVPTRLLDWSYDSLVAAYMAAREVAQKREAHPPEVNSGGRLAVWAFQRDRASDVQSMAGSRGELHPTVNVIHAPTAAIPNLAAQKGLFTMTSHRQTINEPPTALCLERVVANALGEEQVSEAMKKFELPHEEAPRLLRLLSFEFISAASMFPRFEGISKYMQEKGWHEP